MSYFVTDNPVSLRLGTDISLHTSNKISSAVRQNKQYRLELTKMLLKEKKTKDPTTSTPVSIFIICFSGKSLSARVTNLLLAFSWVSEKWLTPQTALRWIYIVVWVSLNLFCFTHIYKGKSRYQGHQCEISFKKHKILALKIGRTFQCWNIF